MRLRLLALRVLYRIHVI